MSRGTVTAVSPAGDAPVQPTSGSSRFGPPIVQDTLISGALTATSLVGAVTDLTVDLPEGAGETASTLDATGIGLILAQTGPLIWRRSAPLAVLVITTGAVFLYSTLGYVRSFAAFGFLIALYTVAAYRDRRISVPAGLAAGFVALLILAISPEPVEPDGVIAMTLIVAAAWFVGDSMRTRRGEFVQLEDRATRLEREREELARQAVDAERRVIARELHDVVAHNVSVIVAQASAARQIAPQRPLIAIETLGNIEDVGREALQEMHRLMALLRPNDRLINTRVPQPGLHDLGDLTMQVRDAGVPITLTVDGTPRDLPAGLDLSAFRIVQEAITNVFKHAGGASVAVTIRYAASTLQVQVDDDGAGAPPPQEDRPPGYGHLGMRERVALFGGELAVGPLPQRGYRVLATLPIEETP